MDKLFDIVITMLFLYSTFTLFFLFYILTNLSHNFQKIFNYLCICFSVLVFIIIYHVLLFYLPEKWIIISSESMLIIGTSFLTNKKIMEKYTKLIKNNNPNSYSIKNFNNYVININIYRILIWCFYVIAVVINSLIKLNLICIENEKWIFLFESAECCAIVSIAIAGLAQVIDKHLKIIQKIDGEK